MELVRYFPYVPSWRVQYKCNFYDYRLKERYMSDGKTDYSQQSALRAEYVLRTD